MHVVDGDIRAIGTTAHDAGAEVIDLDGRLLVPAAVEPHAHLDKAFLAERIANPTGDLMGAIEAMAANRHLTTVADITERAERAARLMAEQRLRRGPDPRRSHLGERLAQRRGPRRRA